MDNFSAQCTDDIIALFKSYGIDTVYVPANCTGELQPMDISVNKPVKTFLKDEFQNWYSEKMLMQLDDRAKQSDIHFKPIMFPMTVMKPIAAKWIIDAVHYIYTHPVLIRNGFRAAGIAGAISELS